MKFIFGTKKFHDNINRFAFWKCGAITYGITLNEWPDNFKYFVQMSNRENTLFWKHKFLNIYTGYEKPPHSFIYYATLYNIVYLAYWIATIISIPFLVFWFTVLGIFSVDKEDWTFWFSAFTWVIFGLVGIYYLILEFTL